MTPSFVPRPIGPSAVKVSPITLGTMRFDQAANARALLDDAFRLGITSIHCSSEYETYPILRAALGELGGAIPSNLSVIAKVASPHFGEDRFSPTEFRSKIQFYLDTLGLDQVQVVQWLLRYDLKDEEGRARVFDDAAQEVGETVRDLRAEGLIGAFVGFPYSSSIAARLVAADFVDGLAVYVNPLEREMDSFVEAAAARGKATIAIRPFAAGRIFAETGWSYKEALDHVFALPGIATAVVSASTGKHLDQLRAAFE